MEFIMKRKTILLILLMIVIAWTPLFFAGDTKFSSKWLGGTLVMYPPEYPGKIFLVNSSITGASDTANSGLTWGKPLASLDAAINKCSIGNEYIFVGSGHNEAMTAKDDVDADVAGITIKGLGTGSRTPTFDYDGAAGNFVIGADNVTLENLRFRASVDSCPNAVEIKDGIDYARIIGCQFGFAEASTDEFDNAIDIDDCNYITIEGCYFDSGVADAVSAIFFDTDSKGSIVRNNIIMGDYATANIVGDTTLSSNLIIENNILWNGATNDIGTQPVIEMLTGTSAIIRDNQIVCNLTDVALAIVCDKAHLFNNYYTEDMGGATTAAPWYDPNSSSADTIGFVSSVTMSGDD